MLTYRKNMLCVKCPVLSLLLTLVTLSGATPALARDLHGRFGLGYNSQFSNSLPTSSVLNKVPGISIKYGLTRDVSAAGIVGISTASPLNSVAGLKLFKNLHFENNLNFYFTFGVGLLNANQIFGAQLLSGFGVEFFIPGLESLGFSVETGGTFDNLSGSFALKTFGVSFLDAGIHFYL